jgi:hypothetical protein
MSRQRDPSKEQQRKRAPKKTPQRRGSLKGSFQFKKRVSSNSQPPLFHPRGSSVPSTFLWQT